MAGKTNRDKDTPIDESILDQTPPDINEPIPKDDDPDNIDPNPDPEPDEGGKKEEPVDDTPSQPEEDVPPLDTPEKKEDVPPAPETTPAPITPPVETQDQKDERYRQQQTEAQIQNAKNRNFISKVDEANQIKEPTEDELKAEASKEGFDWEELTLFEKSQFKRTYISERRFAVVNEAVQSTKQIDAWADKVDTFIDESDGKPEYARLGLHEADFRKYAMQEAHRGTPIDVLAGAFLHNLPAAQKNRTDLFPKGGGGEKDTTTGKITDADAIKRLRESDPREYKRQLKAGKISTDL